MAMQPWKLVGHRPFLGWPSCTLFASRGLPIASRQCPSGSLRPTLLHFLAETELILFWASGRRESWSWASPRCTARLAPPWAYLAGLDFTEPLFVFVIMVVAATRPVGPAGGGLLWLAARLISARESVSFYLAALGLGPLL